MSSFSSVDSSSRRPSSTTDPSAEFGSAVAPSPPLLSRLVSTSTLALLFWALLAVVCGVGQTLYLALSLSVAMPNYPFWVFAVTAFPFLIVFAAVYVGFLVFTNQITPSMRAVSHTKWALIGALTAVNGACLLFAGPHVSGQQQALLGPTVVIVPMCMVAAYFYLGQRYSLGQIAGVIIILGGIVVALLPKLTGKGGSDAGGPKGSIWWDLMWTLGSSPSAFMAVYEEKAFANVPIHMALLMAWATFYQVITIFVVGVPMALTPGLGNSTPSTFLPNQADAFSCFWTGENPHSCPECDCSVAASFVSLFTLNYIVTNYAQLGVVKYGNATLAFIITTLVTPLSFFAFSSSFLTAGNTEPLHTVAIIALVVLLVGVVVYRYFDSAEASSHAPESVIASLPGGFASSIGGGGYNSTDTHVSVVTHSFSAYAFSPFRTTVRSLADHHAKTFSGGYEPLIQKDLGFLDYSSVPNAINTEAPSFFTS